MIADLSEPKEYSPPSAVKKSPAELVAEALNSLFNLFSLSAMFGTHLAIAFSILLFEPYYQAASPVVVSAGTVIGTSALVISSLKPYIVLYNGVILLALFYCIVERHRPEPLQMTTALSLGAVWCDLMVAGSFRDGRVWILLLSILHRLFTSLILVRHWYERRRRRLMKKKQYRRTLEAGIRSLEKQNFALKECREDIGCVAPPFSSRAQKKNQVSIFHRSTLSSPSSFSSTSKCSKSTPQSAAPSSSASYYSAWNSFSGDQTKFNNDRNEKNELSPSPLSLLSKASNPTSTENPEVSLEISFP